MERMFKQMTRQAAPNTGRDLDRMQQNVYLNF